jgi:hypothetical protein
MYYTPITVIKDDDVGGGQIDGKASSASCE